MSRFLNGVLVGVGIGLLIAPMKGDEMRRLVRERYEELRSNLPEQEQLQQAAQKAASKAQQTRSTVSDLAQQSARKVKQTGQDVASTAKKTTASVKQGEQTTTTAPDEGAEESIILVDPIVPDEGAGRLTSEY
jgi:gas vesicle protein